MTATSRGSSWEGNQLSRAPAGWGTEGSSIVSSSGESVEISRRGLLLPRQAPGFIASASLRWAVTYIWDPLGFGKGDCHVLAECHFYLAPTTPMHLFSNDPICGSGLRRPSRPGRNRGSSRPALIFRRGRVPGRRLRPSRNPHSPDAARAVRDCYDPARGRGSDRNNVADAARDRRGRRGGGSYYCRRAAVAPVTRSTSAIANRFSGPKR